jgi:hypothetical protein
MPWFGSGYDSQKRFIDFPVNPTRLEQLQQFDPCFLGCDDPATKRRDNLPGNSRNGDTQRNTAKVTLCR